MKNDLISRSALLADIEDTVVISARNTKSAEMRGIHKVTDRIKSAPAVDAVEVVRCRDCVHDGLPTCFTCYIEQHKMIFLNNDPEFFCGAGERKAYGERRTDG